MSTDYHYVWQRRELRGLLATIPTSIVVKEVLDVSELRTALRARIVEQEAEKVTQKDG